MPWPDAVFLDLDDTILAFDSVSEPSWRTVLQENAQRYTSVSVESLYGIIQTSANQYWRDERRQQEGRLNLRRAREIIIGEAFESIGIRDIELVEWIAAEYTRVRTELIHLIPGAIELISELKANGVKLGLLTNGEAQSQREKINRFQLAPFFDIILIEGECGYGKPDTRVYERALSELKVRAENTWMVGDNWEWEVEAPQRLGIRGIWVNPSNKPLPTHTNVQPFRIIRTLADLHTIGRSYDSMQATSPTI